MFKVKYEVQDAWDIVLFLVFVIAICVAAAALGFVVADAIIGVAVGLFLACLFICAILILYWIEETKGTEYVCDDCHKQYKNIKSRNITLESGIAVIPVNKR